MKKIKLFRHPSQIFLLSLVFFVFGIGIASWVTLDWFTPLLIAVGLVIFCVAFIFGEVAWLVFFIVMVLCGIWRYHQTTVLAHDSIVEYAEQYVDMVGVISEPPDVRIDRTKLTIAIDSVDDQPATGKLLVTTGLYPQRAYGQLVAVSCTLRKPEPFEGFAYDRYLAKEGIDMLCSRPRIKVLGEGYGDGFLALTYWMRAHFHAALNRSLPEPHASITSAMLLGLRRGIPDEVSESFSITGTSHMIAISGLHITIISAILLQLVIACGIPRKKAFGVIVVLLFCYVTLIGYPSSAVRASIMGLVLLGALAVGRLSNSLHALLLAAAGMLLWNPLLLRDDIGFQLSFAAVLGIMYFVPLFENWCRWAPETLGIRSALAMTLAAQVSTLPLIIYYFDQFSLIAPLTNIIVVPLLPIFMLLSLSGLFIAAIVPAWGTALLLPAWGLLSIIIYIIQLTATLPLAALQF